ncbi:hypothetical protein EJ03DRAFT_357989 [Teratosphaeria nubilosa]|uniref:Uncharacterized protein n=1 Tax=Teratosphaeria nubilosa TaxID=161662 RepID=A0A6G1KVC6_9PEZI|nr:hypothetical protein EJ03DRAFT_357989 [Teratosphaeria nubilosa]
MSTGSTPSYQHNPHHRKWHLHLAIKLRHEKLYFDALRHIITSYKPGDGIAPHLLGLTEDEFEVGYGQDIKYIQDNIISKLERDLQKLALRKADIDLPVYTHTICTTFLNMLSFKRKDRPGTAKALERYDYIARTTYGQYITQHLFGQLEAAANSDEPSKIFGAKAVCRISSIFRLGRDGEGEKQVQRILDDLVREAVGHIKEAFDENRGHGWGELGKWFRRCEYEKVKERFTYLPLDEGDVPWKGEGEWVAREPVGRCGEMWGDVGRCGEEVGREWLRLLLGQLGLYEGVDGD